MITLESSCSNVSLHVPCVLSIVTPPPPPTKIKNNKNGIEILKMDSMTLSSGCYLLGRLIILVSHSTCSFLFLSCTALKFSFFKFIFSLAVEAFKDCDNLVLLGNAGNKNSLPVFSFLIYNPQAGRFLHHNFVASLLNDLYGIQARGGCACAGPYAMVCPA